MYIYKIAAVQRILTEDNKHKDVSCCAYYMTISGIENYIKVEAPRELKKLSERYGSVMEIGLMDYSVQRIKLREG